MIRGPPRFTLDRWSAASDVYKRQDDGSALLLATRQWLTPNGRVIWHQGIEPDITVVLPMDVMLITPSRLRTMTPEEFQAAQDVQLQRALETLDKAPNTAHR